MESEDMNMHASLVLPELYEDLETFSISSGFLEWSSLEWKVVRISSLFHMMWTLQNSVLYVCIAFDVPSKAGRSILNSKVLCLWYHSDLKDPIKILVSHKAVLP